VLVLKDLQKCIKKVANRGEEGSCHYEIPLKDPFKSFSDHLCPIVRPGKISCYIFNIFFSK
jgi:hypothetical protein